MFTKEEFDKMVSEFDRIAITSHIGPDPDALASALSVRWYLNKHFPNKSVSVYLEANPRVGMEYIPNQDQIIFLDDITGKLNDSELVIFVDAPEYSRYSHHSEKIDVSKFKSIHIDHHGTPPDKYDLSHIDTTAAAATQLVVEILLEDEDLSDPILARMLLYGILADTGTFKYITPKTARVLSVAEKIIELSGVDLQELDLYLSSYTLEELEVITEYLKNTRNTTVKNSEHGLTYSFISKEIFEKGFTKELLTRAKNNYQFSYLRRVDHNPWGFVVTPREDMKTYRISLRSIPGAPCVRLIAQELGGGGHDMAASGKIEVEGVDSEEVCKMVLEKIETMDLEPVVVKED